MSAAIRTAAPLCNPDRLYLGGQWVRPASGSSIDVVDSATEELYFTIAEASAADMDRAVTGARAAFDEGQWPRLAHTERAAYLRAIAAGLRDRASDLAQLWPRESGVLYSMSLGSIPAVAATFDYYASLADTFAFEQPMPSSITDFGMLVREPVGVVGAIVPWNGPLGILSYKVAPALLAGCTVILKSSPEAPGEAHVLAEIADQAGLPPGVLNVVTAGREVSELLVRDARVDKITFTGSTAAGRRIASICGERIARCTLELGGKSAAVLLDDMELEAAAETLATAECRVTGQVCSSVTRVIVERGRHDELVDALAARFAKVRVGDPFDESTEMGPLAVRRQRDRVERYIAAGIAEGATLAVGGGRPKHLDRGWYVEPTVFGNVDNGSTIAQEEIFGPVLCVIPADDERDMIRIANDTQYGLNGAVFTRDVDRARTVAAQLRSGTVGHNTVRGDLSIGFGGFKQSGIGREGGVEGLLPYLESKTVLLQQAPARYRGAGTGTGAVAAN
jgi:acyl-CoA reductase-like NAD-dependent aldehyde dehydrogenase